MYLTFKQKKNRIQQLKTKISSISLVKKETVLVRGLWKYY